MLSSTKRNLHTLLMLAVSVGWRARSRCAPLQWAAPVERQRRLGRHCGPAGLRAQQAGSAPWAGGRPPLRRPARAAAAEVQPQAGGGRLGFVPLSTLFVGLLVAHKCVVDGLSRYTRVSGVPYSATTAAILGEFVKVPVLTLAVLAFEGRARLLPVLREAVTEKPFALMLPGLAYSIQNILYFEALSHLSVATYQILSQSKLLFTAVFMYVLLQRRLGKRQLMALTLLMLGTLLTQIAEIPRSSAMGGNALWGGLLTFAGSLLSALPNVYYEKVLKTKGSSQWASNIQLTFWIWFWLIIVSIPSLLQGLGNGAGVAASGMLTGFTHWVWLVIWLQSFKCILIPATLKYSDNIIYAYAKPLSILLTAVVTAGVSGIVPCKEFLAGAVLVLASVLVYGS